jgi:hypothetical protein
VSLDFFLGKTYDTWSPKSNSDIAWGKAPDRFIYLSRMVRQVQKRRFIEGLQLDRVAKGTSIASRSSLCRQRSCVRDRDGVAIIERKKGSFRLPFTHFGSVMVDTTDREKLSAVLSDMFSESNFDASRISLLDSLLFLRDVIN